ncbi:MAG: flippase-like domain-containing protein [Bacteroidetes bacterium]|nr:flippase-like domain-containing protein [Bacteroidota bacterium]MBX7047297.1 flippase-like domain-containing protein [Ignavibacteria bacterium]
MFSKYKKKILLSAVFGALIFLGISFYADFDKLVGALGKFNWLFFPIILGLSFLNYIARFFKWEYYLKILNIKVAPLLSFKIFLSAFVMSVTPGKMGEVLKSYLLKEETGTPIAKSAPIIIAERITDFISIIIICITGAYVFDYGRSIIIGVGIFFIGVTLILSFQKLSLAIINSLERIKFISKHVHKIHIAYDSIYQLVKIKPLIVAILISLAAWLFECWGFYYVLKIFSSTSNIETGFLTASFIYCFATLVGAIAMLPGGLGATEASMTGLLIILKIPKDVSAASTIIIRVATLWFAVVVGIIAVYFYNKHSKHKLDEIELQN